MKKLLALVAVAALVPVIISAKADDDERVITRFDGGLGVDPITTTSTGTPPAVTFSLVVNIVRGVFPVGAPWAIRSLKAKVEVGSEIDLKGRGLVLESGPSIGTADGLTSVRAILFCGTTNTQHVSRAGALDTDGDFKIEGQLTPPIGATCPTPTLLIVAGAGTPASPFRWLAAGVPDNDDRN